MPPTKTGSTTKSPLTRQRVFEGAVALADRIGIDGFTIRKLAAELDVKPMTIYHHVPHKEAIIDGMVDLVFAEIEPPPPDEHWKSAIARRARSARAALARHPWATPLVDSRTNPGPETLGHFDAVLGCFRTAGFSVEMAAHAYALVDAFVYGFALQEANLPATDGEDVPEMASAVATQFAAGQYPHLAEFTVEHVLKPDYDFTAEFDYGLDLILDGLDRRT
jgi:AcrR family transcriptional regulator